MDANGSCAQSIDCPIDRSKIDQMPESVPPSIARVTLTPARVTALYAAASLLLLVIAGGTARALVSDRGWVLHLDALLGGALVLMSSAALYGVTRVLVGRQPAAAQPAPRPARGPVARLSLPLTLVAVAAVFGAAVYNNHRESAHDHAEQLQSISAMRATQVAHWLGVRMAQARFARSSAHWAEQFEAVKDRGDPVARERLRSRLHEFQAAFDNDICAIVDADGQVVVADPDWVGTPSAATLDAVQRAITTGEIQRTGLWLPSGQEPTEPLDIVSPLMGAGTQARAAVVLRVDVRRTLQPLLTSWPVPSATSRSTIVRIEHARLVGPGGQTVPMYTPGLIAPPAIRG